MATSGRRCVCRRRPGRQLHRSGHQTPARSRWQLYTCNLGSSAEVARYPNKCSRSWPKLHPPISISAAELQKCCRYRQGAAVIRPGAPLWRAMPAARRSQRASAERRIVGRRWQAPLKGSLKQITLHRLYVCNLAALRHSIRCGRSVGNRGSPAMLRSEMDQRSPDRRISLDHECGRCRT
jgi:hypothetical protein